MRSSALLLLLLPLIACRGPNAPERTADPPHAAAVASVVPSAPSAPDASATAQPDPPVADAGHPAEPAAVAAVDAGPPGCAAPRAIVREGVGDVPLQTDPPVEEGWTVPDDKQRITRGTRTYAIEGEPEGTIVVREGGRVLWSKEAPQVAGGAVDIALSPGGGVLARGYSRGPGELFDARTGARYAEIGQSFAIEPHDRYLLDAPWVAWTSHYTSAEVQKLNLAHAPASRRTVARLPVDPAKDVATDRGPRTSGIAICATGELYVVSHPDGEIAVYRASNDGKLASLPHPPAGEPVFTTSGRHVAVRDFEKKVVGAYRLDP